MSRVDYSKWDHIEISDDEDDTHPNIDTPSLFRWRHQARVERMEKEKKEKEDLERRKNKAEVKKQEIERKLQEAKEKEAAEELSKLQLQMSEIQRQEDEYKEKEKEIKEKEKKAAWNIDTICRDGQSKTIINKSSGYNKDDLTEDEKWERQEQFTKKHKKDIEKFGMLKRYQDSQKFLTDNAYLACEETANYLVLWCVNLEVEEKHDLMKHVAHQTIVIQFILELAKSLDRDPRSCVRPFFNRISMEEQTYKDAFNDELESFKTRVRQRAKARIDEAMKEVEEEERQKRLGPGGLDPVEVFESLPKEMQECFETKDIKMLQDTIGRMSKEDGEYHLKRCIDSGLWVPGGGTTDAVDDDKQQPEDDDDADEVYDNLDDINAVD